MMKSILSAVLALALTPLATNAATTSLTPTADGVARVFGGDSVVTDGLTLAFSQSGSNIQNVILEYDLSSIPDTATIVSATLTFTLSRFVSNSGTNPAAVDVIAYNGDGTIDIGDYSASGTQVVDSSTPQGGVSGDTRNFAFTSVAPITAGLLGNGLTLRLETDSFASIQIGATENTSLDAPQLAITYNVAPVPLPAGLPMLMAGLAVMTCMKRRTA